MKKETLETCTRSLIPIRDTLNIINGKWKIPILFSLMFNDLRFKELEREIKGIGAKMLAKELKELELNHLIKKTPIDKNADAYEYSITTYGRTLKKLITEIELWGIKHREKIMGNNQPVSLS